MALRMRGETVKLPDGVIQVDPLRDPRWDEFVQQHPLAWLSHSARWVRVLSAVFPHLEPCYLALTGSAGKDLVAGLPLWVVRSRLTGNRLVSLPFTTLCDPLIESHAHFEILIRAAKGLLESIKGRFLEVRSWRNPVAGDHCLLESRRDFKYHALSLDRPLDEIKRSFHRRSIRPCIHRAERSGLSCRPANCTADLRRFFEIYVETRKTLALPPLPFRFFESLWRNLHPENLEILLAEKDGRTAAGLLQLKYGDRVSAEASGWNRRLADDCPNHFILWQGIQSAHRQGYRDFDFGRTAADNQALLEFKRRWGTLEQDLTFSFYPGSQRPVSQANNGTRKLVELACRIIPRPLMPALGDVIYRHLS